ncbi:TonB-dependent receptor [Novosphingobium profundi]|uniref:TonB-dependent receptor n=1 Tax=Novosphingobium profundi TaxID=1774954 RepID=UPI001BDAD83E|nr:TonB-dependent receptor [Novosphingobium profundi]MBT0669194.1 TonB-dependent receptor [Novosphingobium profundi]
MRVSPDSRRVFLRLSFLLSSALPALVAVSPVQAQTASDTAVAGEIVVTGIRASLQSALESKRQDVRVTDGISAEDIGKFPAENITEAIQRISGVQMSNINGRGSTISIRGLGPQYALTTINGQTFKSADFTDGFRYDIIQTELASAIEVIKSPTAAMDTGGLSGTVNITTPRPLDYNGRSLIVSVKGQNSEYAGGKITPKVSGSYVGKFLDNTLGVYVNLGYQKLKDRADYFWMDRWTSAEIDGETVTIPRRPRYRRIDRDTTRLMASGGLQWQPTDRIEINATAIYARDRTDYDVNQQVFLFDTSKLSVNTITNGVATSVTATDFTMENNRQHEDRNLASQGYTLSGKWTGDDGWSASTAFNYTLGTTYQREAAAIVGITIPSATIDFTDPDAVRFDVGTDLSDASNYTASSLTRNEYPNGATRKMRSGETSAQFDLGKEVAFGPFSKISAGAKYRHETFNRYVSRHDMIALADAPSADSSVFPDLTSDNYAVSGFLNGSSLIQSAWVAPNLASYGSALAAAGITVPDIFAPEASYHVDRAMPAVYAMADIDTAIGSLPIRGNVGVRYEHTRQKVTGNITAPRDDGYEEVQQKIGDYTVTQNYGNVLPSLSLVAEPARNLQIRFAAAKVLVRPFMDSRTSMAETTSTSANTQPAGTNTVTVDLGQASLKPLTAKQLDLGAEWYFDQGSAITLNGFYKWIKNGTYSALICPASYNGTALSTNSDSDCVDASGNIYDITQTLNDPSIVRIKGFEVSWTQSFDRFLPIDGFGLMANFTRVFPQNEDPDSGYTVRNLSKVTWNLVPYWENEHFNVRASINYRSSYQQTNADSFFAYAGHVVRGRTQIDLSGGYTPNDMLSFTAGVVNLNNSSEEAYYEDSSIWQETSHYGRSFYVSATMKL